MQRRLLMLLIAATLACVDLAHKRFARADYHHARSPVVVLVTVTVVIALLLLVPRFPSAAALVGAAIAAGGAIGNAVSAIVWRQGVPDPLVLTGASRGIAFNLADVFVFMGDVVMLSAVVMYALRHRVQLRANV